MTTEPRSAILLTGSPGIGKSTSIQKTIQLLNGECGGFFTREILERDQRAGFEIVTLDGQTALLATRKPIFFDRGIPFKGFTVNLDAVEKVAVPALLQAAQARKLVIVDEIGPMEIFSDLFCNTVLGLFNNLTLPLLGTVVYRSNLYANQIKQHPRAVVKTVTLENRDSIPTEVIALLKGDKHE